MPLQIDQTEQSTDEFRIPEILHIKGECPQDITKLTVNYFALLVIDPAYRGLVYVNVKGQTYTSALSSEKPYVTFDISKPDRWQQFRDYFREGVWHIWTGL